MRRVTFDLVGLPPSEREITAFLADSAPGAYERVVDRLLASPRYGERWARHWLDLVRYAETYGHEFDFDIPHAYRYRDYVIRAFNDDLPYDQFIVEQVAGDLLVQPRRHPIEGFNESIIGTGAFLFGEAKHAPVDVRQDEADRIDNQIDVFAKTFLALTVSCARCHDHKFDAIATKDYYALAGYLQSSRCQQAFIDPPQAHAAPLQSLAELRTRRHDALATCLRAARTSALDPFAGATDLAERRQQIVETLNRQLFAEVSAADTIVDFSGGDFAGWTATGEAFGDGPLAPLDENFAANPNQPAQLAVNGAAHSGLLSGKLQGVLRSPTFEITKPKICYRVYGTGGSVRLIVDGLQLIRDPIYGGLQFAPGSTEPRWHQQDVSKWIGHRAYIELVDADDGYLALERAIQSDGPPPAARANRLVAAMLAEAAAAPTPDVAGKCQSLFSQVLTAWLADPAARPADASDRAAIVNCILQAPWLPAGDVETRRAELSARLTPLADQQLQLENQLTPPSLALAMADGTAENEHVFIRGSHKTLGEEVPRRFLEVLGGTKHAAPAQGSGRLELARQLTSPDNPLVSRVIVNRLWHLHFGAGIVRSVDDFGVMGQPPTHPELLDYLARELVRSGWSLKHVHRVMVLSATYQMSSRSQPAADAADPLNNLWHRMPVRRLEAECIRDAILAVSGSLDGKMYGPGVMPYLTPYMTGRGRPTESGPLDGNGRRSIYLAVRRNFLSPMFQAFDYPTPFTTMGRRGTSNVPAQALAMMNNAFVVEQSARWATRVLAEPAKTPDVRIRSMYLAALGREPDDAELQAALAFVAADKVSAGVEPHPAQAWTDFAHVLLNLKEFIFIP